MILSRIIHHLKTQNWTAVGLEFVIVIAGVVIGFQVTAWNQAREGEARGQAYLERIQSDLAVDIASYDDRIAFWSAVSDHGVQALEASNDPDRISGTQADWALIVAFFANFIGLILGIVALVQSRKAGVKNTPAVWAIIVGSVLFVLSIIIGIIVIVAITAAAGFATEAITACDAVDYVGTVIVQGIEVDCSTIES